MVRRHMRAHGIVYRILLTLLSWTTAAVAQAGSLQGTVTLEGGGPLAGVDIVADAGAGFYNASTDALGVYGLPSVPPGSYHVQAELSPYALSHHWNVSVGSATSTTLDFTLRVGGGSISGQVLDGDDQPIAGATVDTWQVINGQLSGGTWGRATTSPGGTFTIGHPITTNGLPTGTYLVKASKAGSPDGTVRDVAVVAGEDTAGVTIRLIAGTASMLGRITDPEGVGIAGALVYAESAVGAMQGFTDASGNYGIGSLPGASYHVLVTAAGYVSAHQYGINVPEGGVLTGVDFTLGTDAGTLTGRVTDADSGLPIAGASLFADSDQGSGWGAGSTDGDGMYTLSGLAPMAYFLHASKNGYAGQFRVVAVEPNVVSPGNDFELVPANGAIAGQVTLAGNPVANAEIYINSSAGAMTVIDTHCATGTDGRYLCQNLSDGLYDVHLSSVLGYANQVRFMVQVASEGTTNGVDFAVANGEATITGGVSDPDSGAPLVGAKVQAFLEENPGTWAVAFTDAEGRYVMENLWGGNYLMTATLAGYAPLERASVPVSDTGTTIVNLPSGDGPACAAPTAATDPPAVILKAKVVPGRKLVLKGTLPFTIFPMVDGVTVVVGDAASRSACLAIAPGGMIPHRGGLVMTYKDKTVTEGITSLKLKRIATGGFDFVVKGVGVDLLMDGTPEIRVGVNSKSTTTRGTATLTRRGGKYVGP
jgi:protocatechuate 3,4-dioxygenase beta subunit